MLKRVTLVLFLAAVSLVAQEKSTATQAVYRFEYTILTLDGAKKVQSQNYSLLAADQREGRLRVGYKIPIRTGESQLQYYDVGVNIDASPVFVDPASVRLRTRMEVRAVAEREREGSGPRQPVIQDFSNSTEVTIPLDKPVILTSQDEPTSKMTIQVQVVARVFK